MIDNCVLIRLEKNKPQGWTTFYITDGLPCGLFF